ncbi:tail fiber domain-containing protein [Pseudomonas alloputida]|uniref:tail fiber domain-containing protein n=1 Tax=Pseudomonas alloputida TaxID=1940621 RepID=UPI003B42E4D1
MELKSIYAQDQRGNVLPGASAALYLAGTTTLATGLQRKDGSALSNPFAADSTGLLEFAALDGSYDLAVTSGPFTSVNRLMFSVSPVITPEPFGAKGDGSTNDNAAFTQLEFSYSGRDVDLLGKTYVVNSIPTANRYFGGFFKVSANTKEAPFIRPRNSQGIVTFRGACSALSLDYSMPSNQFTFGNHCFAAGEKALDRVTAAKQTIAIGGSAMEMTLKSFENTAIGECALQHVQSATDTYSTTLTAGTRNVAIGGGALQYLDTGLNNVAIGRNSSVGMTACIGSVAVGSNCLGGQVYPGWEPSVENFLPNANSDTYITAVGSTIGSTFNGSSLTAFGTQAGRSLKTGFRNTLLGDLAGNQLEATIGWNGKTMTSYDSTNYVTYTKTGNNVVVTAPGHGAVVGGLAFIYWAVGGPCYANHGHAFPVTVTAVDGDTFTVQCPYVGNGTGNARLYWTTSLTDAATPSRHNVFAGSSAAEKVVQSTQSVVVGALAAQNIPVSLTSAVIIGYGAGQNMTTTPNSMVAIGTSALRDNTANVGGATAIGHNAGLLMQDGSLPSVSVVNSTMLGQAAAVSGANQVQLGNASTTTYVYGTVQNRSDERDKAEIRDTVLGLDFINALRPVDFKWDMRDDYIEIDEVEDGFDEQGNPKTRPVARRLERDGSKIRKRFHHGLVAQEVQAVIEQSGIDFGGYQDHLVEGGCDVKTIGYDELIGPLIKAVQQLSAQVKEMQSASEGGLQP